jgi:CubicO group peptidase (beta-lactamase class C family)
MALATALIRPDAIETTAEIDGHWHIGSNAKAMTATLCAIAVERGLLEWDDVVPYLSHSAGILPLEEDEDFVDVPEDRAAAAQWLLAQPRLEEPRYSNGGYCVAAWLLEQAAGATWELLLHDWLAEPLGIDLRVGWPDDIDGHYERDGELVRHDRSDGYVLHPAIRPAGDVNATIGDYARFVQLHLRGLLGDAELLTHESFVKLHTPAHKNVALGWGVQQWEGAETHAHSGSADTFYCVVVLQPERELAAAAVTNSGGEIGQKVATEALRATVAGRARA